MSTKWTTEQKRAISVRNCNTLVSAAAGSGKTAVLVERVIDMITDESNPVYINELLIATFTNAAASEMQDRIYNALRKRIEDDPDNAFLREQVVLLDQAQISTIHSFCMNLIRENFHLLGIRHDFDIADEVKLYLLKKNALEEVLERKYSSSDTDFFETVDAFGGKKNDDNLSEIILSVYNFAESLPDPIGWLDNAVNFLEKDDSYLPFKNIIVNSIRQQFIQIKKEYETALDLISGDGGLMPYYDIYLNEHDFFENILDDDKFEKICNLSFERLPRKGKDADPSTSEYVKNIRDNAKSIVKKIYDLCVYTDDEVLDEIRLIKPFVKTISNMVSEYKAVFSANKRKENILDFNDLEHFAIKLLEENTDIREYMKGFYKEILVDEYQDTNGVQAYLFELLSNGNNLFMVGDVKQSIYGFRNSNPKYFIDKYNVFDFEGNSEGVKINLSQNFRSSNNIINVVNNYFVKLMLGELGGVTYNKEHSLVYGNESIKDIDNSIERYVINTKSDVPEDVEVDKVQAEAIFTANRIINLVEKEKPEIFDKNINGYRPVTYKDIVILMRKTKGIASVYADILGERGIPVYTAESGGYFNCIEVATVISFLKVIENPLQDIPLLAIMRSPVFGFDDNFIAQIRAENRKIRFYNLLKKSSEEKVIDFISYIDKLREFAAFNNVGAVVRKIVFDTGYYQFVGGLTNGEVRMLNLNLLCERADKFSKNGYKGVSKFISYVNNMIESGNEYSSPKLISENDNVVTIMSVHKSKGLEFPVVFLCESGLQFNKMDLSKPIVYDEELGLVTDVVDVKRRIRYVPYVKRAMCEKKLDELVAEEIRLLYVALTRAKYKLIITGSKALADNFEDLEYDDFNAYTIKLKKCYLDMLLMNISGIEKSKTLELSEVLAMDDVQLNESGNILSDNSYSEFYDDIAKRLDFEYKYSDCKFIPSKKSISEVVSADDEIHLAAAVAINNDLTSAQRGTLIHFVLQNLDLSKVKSIDEISQQVDKMIDDGIFDEKHREVIDSNSIYAFFNSDIGKRMLNSAQIYREFKFCVDLPAKELGYDNDTETILMQGVIDCCFLEDGQFVIIDYKTGSLKDKYKRQIELYQKCLELSTGKYVKETHIYPLI